MAGASRSVRRTRYGVLVEALPARTKLIDLTILTTPDFEVHACMRCSTTFSRRIVKHG